MRDIDVSVQGTPVHWGGGPEAKGALICPNCKKIGSLERQGPKYLCSQCSTRFPAGEVITVQTDLKKALGLFNGPVTYVLTEYEVPSKCRRCDHCMFSLFKRLDNIVTSDNTGIFRCECSVCFAAYEWPIPKAVVKEVTVFPAKCPTCKCKDSFSGSKVFRHGFREGIFCQVCNSNFFRNLSSRKDILSLLAD